MQNENENEIWVSVPFDMDYEVSSLGRIKSYKRNKEKLLSPHKNIKGYMYINLCVNKKRLVITVHRLMALAFFGVNTDHNTVVDHIDGNKSNNLLENLRIVSQRENASWERSHRDLPMGVYRTKSPGIYRVLCRFNDKVSYLGSFPTPELASEAYQNHIKSLQK